LQTDDTEVYNVFLTNNILKKTSIYDLATFELLNLFFIKHELIYCFLSAYLTHVKNLKEIIIIVKIFYFRTNTCCFYLFCNNFMESVCLFPETGYQVDDISIDFTLSSHLLNRTQWYCLQCKFSQKDKPAFVGQTVAIDPSVSFQDGRKRTPSLLNSQPPFLSLSVSGVCSITGKMLQKCQKCKAQDKVTTNRKRKRDVTDSWTYVDEGNNAKLFQVMNSAPKVDEEGIIKLRFRALCCIGATRQFHNNHVNVTEGDEEGIHKGCDGFLLTVILFMDGGEIFRRTAVEPVRVIGKVPKSQSTNSVEKPREKYIQKTCNLDTSHFYPESESPSPTGSPTVSFGGDHNGYEITPLSDDSHLLFGTQVIPRDPSGSPSKKILDCPDNLPLTFLSTEETFNRSVSTYPLPQTSSFPSPGPSYRKPFRSRPVSETNFENGLVDNPPLCECDEGENCRNSECDERRAVQSKGTMSPGYKGKELGVRKERMDMTFRREGWKTGISDFLEAIQEGMDLFAELRNTALLFKIKIDSRYPIVYRKIFEPDFFKQANLLKIPSESTELLTICNVIYEGTLCQESSSVYSKNKAEQLCLIGETIAHQLLKISIRDLSSEEMLNLADALTRTGIIQVHQRKDLASGRHFLHQSFHLYEYLSVNYPHLRNTPYYEIMMWHRCFLDPDPSMINSAFEWVRTIPQSRIFPHIIFLMIFSVCYPGLSSGAAGVPERPHLPGDSQTMYLLGLCNDLEDVFNGFIRNNGNVVPSNGMLINSAIGALRSWLMCDLDQAVEDVEESAIQASLLANAFMDPLPVQIAIFVAIQLMGIYSLQEPPPNQPPSFEEVPLGGVAGDCGLPTPPYYYDPEEDKRRRRLVHYVELLVKASRMALVRVWTAPLEVFNLAMFHKFCRVSFPTGYGIW